jgi:hypothetical protein
MPEALWGTNAPANKPDADALEGLGQSPAFSAVQPQAASKLFVMLVGGEIKTQAQFQQLLGDALGLDGPATPAQVNEVLEKFVGLVKDLGPGAELNLMEIYSRLPEGFW